MSDRENKKAAFQWSGLNSPSLKCTSTAGTCEDQGRNGTKKKLADNVNHIIYVGSVLRPFEAQIPIILEKIIISLVSTKQVEKLAMLFLRKERSMVAFCSLLFNVAHKVGATIVSCVGVVHANLVWKSTGSPMG